MNHQLLCNMKVIYDSLNPDESKRDVISIYAPDHIPRTGEEFTFWSCLDSDDRLIPNPDRTELRFAGIVQRVRFIYEERNLPMGNQILFVIVYVRPYTEDEQREAQKYDDAEI